MKIKNHISIISSLLIIFVLVFCIKVSSQDRYFQVQIGSQIMQNYNLGKLDYSGWGFGGFQVNRERVATTLNHDISISRIFDRHHGVTFVGGMYATCRWIDVRAYTDINNYGYYNVKPCYKNYSIYLLYQYTQWISTRWNGHLSVGPMWAKNNNIFDWFYIPVKLNYFSGMAKLGVQYKISDHFSVELNAAAVRSFVNIVDAGELVDVLVEGSFIPLLVGADLRVGYQF